MGRTPCCDKNGLKKGPWTPEEDLKLSSYIEIHGAGNWRNLPKNAGLQRCGKSCRLRWTNYLRPDIKRGRFSFEEEETIIQLHSVLGNKWSAIAGRLPGRTDNEIKNYWNTHIRKRLVRNGVDPITHAQRLDFLDISSILNVSNLLRAQALLNPNLLTLANTLLNPNQLSLANTLLNPKIQGNPEMLLQYLKQNQQQHCNSQQNLDLQASQLQIQAPFACENFAASSNIPMVPFACENYDFSFDSVRPTPTPISSPNPLNSSATLMNGSSTSDEEMERFSSLLEFDIQESLNVDDYFVNM